MTLRNASALPTSTRLLATILAAPLILSTAGCVDLAQMLARPESKTSEPKPQVAATPPEGVPDPIPAPQEKSKPGKLYEWNGQGQKLSRIVVNTDEQKARFYVGDEQVGWTTVASGVPKHATPVGHFEVIEKVANKRSNLYGKIYGKGGQLVRSDAKAGTHPIPAGARFEGAKMPYFLRLTYDGVGLHAGPIPRPGRPASHGCIRLPAKMAPVLFEHVGVGTKVSIVGRGPDYGNYAQKQRALAAERAAREKERREIEARTQEALAGGPAAGAGTTEGQASLTASAVATASPADTTEVRRESEALEEARSRPTPVAAAPAPARKPVASRPAPRPVRRAIPATAASTVANSPVASAATQTTQPATALPEASQLPPPITAQPQATPEISPAANSTPAGSAPAQPAAPVATASTEAPKPAPAEASTAKASEADSAAPTMPTAAAVPTPDRSSPGATPAPQVAPVLPPVAAPAPPAPTAVPTAPAAPSPAPSQQSAAGGSSSGV